MVIDDCIKEALVHIRDGWFLMGFNQYGYVNEEIESASKALCKIPKSEINGDYELTKLKIYHLYNYYNRTKPENL